MGPDDGLSVLLSEVTLGNRAFEHRVQPAGGVWVSVADDVPGGGGGGGGELDASMVVRIRHAVY
jgi:hypothetical protein